MASSLSETIGVTGVSTNEFNAFSESVSSLCQVHRQLGNKFTRAFGATPWNGNGSARAAQKEPLGVFRTCGAPVTSRLIVPEELALLTISDDIAR
jgi:hypothetical protein